MICVAEPLSGLQNGSLWLAMGSYLGKTKPRAPRRSLDTSWTSGTQHFYQKSTQQSPNTKILIFTVFLCYSYCLNGLSQRCGTPVLKNIMYMFKTKFGTWDVTFFIKTLKICLGSSHLIIFVVTLSHVLKVGISRT